MAELLHCPFCGCAGLIAAENYCSGERVQLRFYPRCSNRECFLSILNVPFENRSVASRIWNTRFSPGDFPKGIT